MKATTIVCQLIYLIILILHGMTYLIDSIYISVLLNQHSGNFNLPMKNRIMQRIPTKLQQQGFIWNEVISYEKSNGLAEIYQIRNVHIHAFHN